MLSHGPHSRTVRILLAATCALGCDNASAAMAPQDLTSAVAEGRSEKVVGGAGLTLTVYDAGRSGARSVVFIHGFTQNALTWDHQFRGLADRFHVVAYDLRGHGASEKPLDAAQYTDPALWADDLAAVIRSRGLDRPVLVGWSYGGYVIADYIRRYGDAELGGLVFVAATTKNGTEEAAAHLTEDVLEIFPQVLASDVRTSLAGTRALTKMFAGPRPEEWELAFGSAMMVPSEVRLAMFSRLLDNDDVLARIGVATLVVHGRRDRIVRVAAAEHTARTVPGARLLVYPGAGHAPHLDHAARFSRDLAEFIASIR
jgi:non-heme chloroperoxidase